MRARVRLQLFYPKPRSDQSAAHDGYPQNRITFRPHFYFGKTNKEIDFVFFLNEPARRGSGAEARGQPDRA